MKKEALAAIMATALLVLSLLSPVAGAVSVSYAADSGGDSVSISESYDMDDTTAVEIKEDLIRSQDQLLKSLEQLIWDLYENVNYNVSTDQKKYSLKSFEDLMLNQSEHDDLLEELHGQDPPLEEPQPGFCGIYRNFIPTRASGGHPDFNCNVVNGPSPGLIENNPPWRPTSPPQIEDDWYHTASCLVTIDPAVEVASWSDFTGLDFTPNITAWYNIHPELDEGLSGDPCYFTAHWETTITVVADWLDGIPVTFKMCANDDSWFFLDGELIIDRGGGHQGCPPESPDTAVVPLRSGTYAIDLFYAERCDMGRGGMFEFGISPGPPQVIINDPSHICAKKSFEDLLKRQAERIKSFEDLFETIPPSNRTFELFESFENLTKEQGELLKSFERMIKNETPPDSDVNRTEENYLLEAELVNLLDSFEDLLHSQYELIESFDDLLDESKEYLFIESELNFTKLLFSKEDLIRSQDQLLESFEHLIGDLFENVNYNVSVDQKEYFLKSFEDLLMNQSELLKSFEDLLEWWYEQDPPLEDPQPGFWGIYRNFDNKTRNDFGISAKPGGPWPPGPPFTGLVADTLPWGPSDTGLSFSPNFATPPDWYKTPSSLIRIDPAIIVPFFGIGLDFTFLTDECYKEPDFPEELDEGLPGDPCHFTVHWETRITTKNITSVTLTVGCDDDCWVYANGDLIVDCGGLHPYTVCSKSMPVTPGGTYDIDIFYTERYGGGGNLRFGISPEWGITINCPKELCAKKSFEDLLKRQAERIKSFEDLFETIPPSNRTFELFESFENLTKEQGELLKSFEGLIKNEIPPDSDVNRTEGDYLLEAELVNLLDSFEDLLHSQYELIESFDDLLDESKEYLFIESELNFTKLLFSKEDLIRSQDQLLESFEQLIGDLFENVNYNVSIDQKEYFLKSFEDLLMNQSELLKEFEVLLEWWWYKHNLSEPPQVIISDTSEIFAKESFEDLLKRQEERIKRFEGVLENYSAMESDF